MNNRMPWGMLAKYFMGELSEKQAEKFENWINSDPNRKKRISKLYQIWKEARASYREINSERAWEKLEIEIDQRERNQVHSNIEQEAKTFDINRYVSQNERHQSKSKKIRYTALAALFLLAVSFSILKYSAENINGNSTGESVAVEQVKTEVGQRATYILSDGSKVVLHAESKLEIPINYGVGSREVYLEGEAYFEIEHDESRDFIVHSAISQTRVLGTKFLVRAWPTDNEKSEVEVIVADGEVAFGSIHSMGDEIVLNRLQGGLLIDGAVPVRHEVRQLEWYLGWIQGELVFDNRPLKEVIPKLERWYVQEIDFENKTMGDMHLSAEINYDQPMSEVLNSIALALDLEIIKENGVVIFKEQ